MKNTKEKIKEEMVKATTLGLTDKALYHAYEEIYPELLERYLGKNNNILEVGISTGGGLLFLSESFPESVVYGLDHDLSNLRIQTVNTNIKLLKEYSQVDPNFTEELPGIDIVIEDASHDYSLSMKTFELMLPKLNKGAIYIIEDVYPEFIELYQKDDRFVVHDIRHIKGRGDDVIAVYYHS